jgi:hypothetical protein
MGFIKFWIMDTREFLSPTALTVENINSIHPYGTLPKQLSEDLVSPNVL